MFTMAFINTLFVVPPLEPFMLAVEWNTTNMWYFGFMLILADLFAAAIGYGIGASGNKVFINVIVNEKQMEKVKQRTHGKSGWVSTLLFAATPLPFTAIVYYAGIRGYNFKHFLLATAIGRFLKYTLYIWLLIFFWS